MKTFVRFLNRYFGAEHDVDSTCGNVIFVFEKYEYSEPLFILHEWDCGEENERLWFFGNVYSNQEHGAVFSEAELIQMVKAGKIVSQYQ